MEAFSCKGRGLCSSCGGRRMADTAAHLIDRVFTEAPVRQWVRSLPFGLRYRLAYDAGLVRAVLQVFVSAVFASLRCRARGRRAVGRIHCGAVTFIQRFGGALNLNLHFHTLALDGVYAASRTDSAVRFRPLPPPDDAEVARVTRRIARGIARLLRRKGLGPEADAEHIDALPREEPLLAALYGASVHGRIATGPRAGQRVTRLGDRIEAEDAAVLAGPRCARVAGVSVHANVAVPARDRQRLERLCRYAARPPIAADRLSTIADGRVIYALKRRYRDGTSHVLFEPQELMEKLAALVPPPKFNLVRYHGILAPAAHGRGAAPLGRAGPGARTASLPRKRAPCRIRRRTSSRSGTAVRSSGSGP